MVYSNGPGGDINGIVTNVNSFTMSGSNTVRLVRNSQINNLGVIQQTNSVRLDLQLNVSFENAVSGTYLLSSPAGIFSDDYAPGVF